MTETYARDSDKFFIDKNGKKFKASLCAHFMKPGEIISTPLYMLEPIEESPMPWPLTGDVVQLKDGVWAVKYTDYQAKVAFKVHGKDEYIDLSEILKIWQEGKLIWEAKKQ